MNEQISWVVAYPEILLLIMTCVISLVDVSAKSRLRSSTYVLTLLTLGVVAYLQGASAATGEAFSGFGGMVVSDPMGQWLKCFAALAMMATLVYGRRYAGDRDMLARGGEMFSLALYALLGMFVMISGHNFLVIYLGLELLTLSSYALVALRRDNEQAIEAAMKYFVLGALASGFLLYGLSLVYGATASLDVGEVMKAIAGGEATLKGSPQVLTLGLVFVVAGLAFKLGVVPFHMWVPDVYHGAPTAVTLMIGGAPKLAAFAIVIRLLVEGLAPLAVDWQQMLAVLSVASLLIGNLAAIAQTNLKRMLAFSTIAQMGFMLLGLLAGVVAGGQGLDTSNMANAYGSSMFYVVTYVLTTLGTFGVILLLSRSGFESDNVSDLAGLNQRSPLYAAVMAVCMFSLAGVPPLVGFYAKLSVLQALLASSQPMYIGLAVFAVLMSLIGAFYYLRLVKVMYFDKPTQTADIAAGLDARSVLSLNGALVLILGIVPGGLMAICAQAITALLA
ncbi:NADH-quinone oxidoreductase subunit NuoN [Hydrogenophaga sp. A37]|uniref:NADH-quinone oxidoreductase subunit NuoN n=1 Tax=Hydrogenophaga sp. A37 TaxID=1945864 RepID=UPI00098705F9|nr:NADH-quinone oxidoreductase subunit NuoN [Hydrogenophaga sp. A37]OOG82578.1 NADH-quinone oxidoreductase subunit N [Hydrogenophaga sp. A37]